MLAGSSDVGVVGAGIVGLSVAWALLERGVEVTVYERGLPGNDQSGGETRLFRHGHDDPRMVRLARRSRAAWADWEHEFGLELVSRDGVVALGAKAQQRLATLESVGGVRARAIETDEVASRLPLLARYHGPAVLDEDGGAIRTTATIGALTDRLGDRIVADHVVSVRTRSQGSAEVRTGGATAEHDRVVVCAGRGAATLARGVGLDLPVSVMAHVRLTFRVRDPAPGRVACLQDASDAFGSVGAYGAPTPTNDRFALGLSDEVETQAGGGLADPAALARSARGIERYAAQALPGVVADPVGVRHCWVTKLGWSDDGVAVWDAGALLFLAGNNLYKHAPSLGRAVADAVATGEVAAWLQPEAQLGRAP